MKGLVPWAIRLFAIAVVASGFNYWLHTQGQDAAATHNEPNQYARVRETNFGSYSGVAGNVWTGAPDPVPGGSDPSFSNQTLWAVNTGSCGGLSWVEAGWTKKGTNPITYKFIYKVPGTNNCTYTEVLFGNPQYNSFHWHQLEYCASGCTGTKWRWYLDQVLQRTLETGWQNANYVQAGGEVGGSGVGMQGGINSLYYRRATTWYSFDYADSYRCDYGYNLIWNGTPYNIYDWGYNPPGGCPA